MNECATKYPILLVHGMGFRDRKHLNYWGRIPKKLEAKGAQIFYGHQDSNATIEENAVMVAKSLSDVLSRTGAEKVNIIAHSKGGLEARYLISSLGMADKVATLSTINTPHNGSRTVDRLLKFPRPLIKIAGKCTDIWMRLLGDKSPDTFSVLYQFKSSSAAHFNEENPAAEGVYYQSFWFKMKHAFSDITMVIPYLAVKLSEGDNDGLLPESAIIYGNYRGMYTSSSGRGISHADEVDLRRMRFTRKKPSNDHEVSDITEFYIQLVSELKGMGY